jgi:hypothetical protein
MSGFFKPTTYKSSPVCLTGRFQTLYILLYVSPEAYRLLRSHCIKDCVRHHDFMVNYLVRCQVVSSRLPTSHLWSAPLRDSKHCTSFIWHLLRCTVCSHSILLWIPRGIMILWLNIWFHVRLFQADYLQVIPTLCHWEIPSMVHPSIGFQWVQPFAPFPYYHELGEGSWF